MTRFAAIRGRLAKGRVTDAGLDSLWDTVFVGR
jgi:hypothetical protein